MHQDLPAVTACLTAKVYEPNLTLTEDTKNCSKSTPQQNDVINQFARTYKALIVAGIIYQIVESLFILSVVYLLVNANAASYDGEILHAHTCRPCAGHVLGFMSIAGVVVPKIMTFFYKMRACRPSPAGASKACALLLIAQAL